MPRQTADPKSAGTLTSKPSSPVKLTRKTRMGTPQMYPGATPMCGMAEAEMSMSTSPVSTARLGPLDRDHRPLLGGRGEPHLEVGPFRLPVVLHHRQHPGRAARGGGDVEGARAHARH